MLKATWLLGISHYGLLLSSDGIYWTHRPCLMSSKLMGDSWEPNFKTLSPSLLSIFVCFRAWHFNWHRGLQCMTAIFLLKAQRAAASRCLGWLLEFGGWWEPLRHKHQDMPWIQKRTSPALGCRPGIRQTSHQSLGEPPFLVAPPSRGTTLILSPSGELSALILQISVGAWGIWFQSSDGLLPSNPFWFPQKMNWTIPGLCQPTCLHCCLVPLLFFIFHWDFILLWRSTSLGRYVILLETPAFPTFPQKAFP